MSLNSSLPGSATQDLEQDFGRVCYATIDEEGHGQRLDNFLLARFRGAPRSLIYRIIRKGEVRVNKARSKPEYRVKTGDLVRIPPLRMAPVAEAPNPPVSMQQRLETAILYEDDKLIVLNKPAGIAVHGGSGVSFGLIETLRAARPDARFLELVHRLDRDTSGVIMVAKKRSALNDLQDQIRARTVNKVYHLLVAGIWPASLTEIDQPLQRRELASGERIVRVASEGKASQTFFRVLETFSGYSLIEARPVTGRTHQIRVHCQYAGYPIAGDDKYMDDASLKAFRSIGGKRLMLHARSLTFRLPGETHQASFESPYDENFMQLLQRLSPGFGQG